MNTTVTSRGFTLLEVMVSISISTVLFAALGSCIVIASRAYPSPNSPLSQSIAATHATDMMISDLRFAKTVVSGGNRSLVFTVADRTSDGVDDVIGYVWSGVAGDPLVRYFNSVATDTVITSVQRLDMAYDTRTITGTAATRTVLDRVLIDLESGAKGAARPTRSAVITIASPEIP